MLFGAACLALFRHSETLRVRTMSSKFAPPAACPTIADAALWRPHLANEQRRPSEVLWLDRGECIDPVFLSLIEAQFRGVSRDAIFAYPSPGPLYRKLGVALDLDPSALLLTRGSDGAIKAVYEAFIAAGEKVLTTDPTYQMYGVYAQIFGARLVTVPYRMVDGRPHLGAEEIVSAIFRERPKLVGLPNPDNPTGSVFEEQELRAIIEAAGEVGALMLVDEAYHPFYPITALPWVKEYGHLVVARTFSKGWGMAGIRLGYIASTPEVVALLNKSRTMVEADGVAMALAERMLDFPDEMQASVARLREGRTYFASEMKSLGFHTIETAGNFIHVHFGDKREAVEQALKSVARFRVFPDTLLQEFCRFTTSTKPLMKRVVVAIKGAVDRR